jgi:single-strand DNA-binding protein
MINSVSLTGRITKDIELKYTQSGIAVGSFTLAVDRQFRSENGDRETDFINCVIWRKSAENLSQYTRKGSLIGVSGHLQVRNYENKQGQRVYVTEVVVDNFALLESKAATQASAQTEQNYGGQSTAQSANMPQSKQKASTTGPFANNGQPIDVSDDELPF